MNTRKDFCLENCNVNDHLMTDIIFSPSKNKTSKALSIYGQLADKYKWLFLSLANLKLLKLVYEHWREKYFMKKIYWTWVIWYNSTTLTPSCELVGINPLRTKRTQHGFMIINEIVIICLKDLTINHLRTKNDCPN